MIKEVKVIDGCISCRNCETVCSDVFKVNPKSKVITDNFDGKDSEILMAELMCPVNVIKVKKEGNFTLSFKKAKLISKKYLTQDTLELNFETNNFSFKPGQYISLQMSDLTGKFSRSYSIAKATKNSFTLTVKILEKGRGGKFLTKLKTGKKIDYLGALGNFYLKNTDKEKIFIATGTGLAPMIAMLEKTPAETKKTVIFGVRFEKDIYYKEILENFPNTKVIIKISRPNEALSNSLLNKEKEQSTKTHFSKGRVTDCLSEIPLNSEVYICGNPEMVDSVREGLIERGHPENIIFNESFTVQKNYPGLLKDIFYNGNIPGVNIFSWIIILISLVLIPLTYKYLDKGLLWDISWRSVVFVMAIRPLADLFPKLGFLAKLVYLRKAFGILSSSIILFTLFYNHIIINPDIVKYYLFHGNWNFHIPLLSRLSEITGLILLLTSNHFSQKKLGIWWKRIQRLSYIYFLAGGIVAAAWAPMKIYPVMGAVIFLWILAAFRIKLCK